MITIKDYSEKSFEELMEQLNEEWDDIHTYEAMIGYAGYLLNIDNLHVAIHMLEIMRDKPADWYLYDYTMGTMVTPKPIICKANLKDEIAARL